MPLPPPGGPWNCCRTRGDDDGGDDDFGVPEEAAVCAAVRLATSSSRATSDTRRWFSRSSCETDRNATIGETQVSSRWHRIILCVRQKKMQQSAKTKLGSCQCRTEQSQLPDALPGTLWAGSSLPRCFLSLLIEVAPLLPRGSSLQCRVPPAASQG
jgi:hypothetical protein